MRPISLLLVCVRHAVATHGLARRRRRGEPWRRYVAEMRSGGARPTGDGRSTPARATTESGASGTLRSNADIVGAVCTLATGECAVTTQTGHEPAVGCSPSCR